MTEEQRYEFAILKLANEDSIFAIDISYSNADHLAAIARLMERRWISLIDTAPLEAAGMVTCRVYLVAPIALVWLGVKQAEVMLASKPNCYQCVHRRNLPGNTHSRCAHPIAGEIIKATPPHIAMVLEMWGGAPMLPQLLGIEARSQHGIDNGWFGWPFNFDPVWLLTCDGFKPKETGS